MSSTRRGVAAVSLLLLPALLVGVRAEASLLRTAAQRLITAAAGVQISPTVLPPSGGLVIVNGEGFGDSSGAFAKLGWSAKVDGKAATLNWASSTALRLSVPPGVLGTSPSVVITKGTATAATDTTSVRYGAGISKATATTDAAGPVLKLVGGGFSGSDGWTLTPEADGGAPVDLPVGTDPDAIGVVLGGDTSATVRLPAAPGPAGGYRLAFTPANGMPFGPTEAGRYVYRAPTLTGVSPGAVSTAGGVVTVKGTGLLAVDRGDPAAVVLTSVADPAVTAALQVTAATDTTLTVAVPTAPTGADGAPATGDYTLGVTTPLGAATAKTKPVVAYVAPPAIALANAAALPAPGGTVLLAGSGFGASKNAFGALKLSATVGGKKAPLAWVSDTRVALAVPPGVPGQGAAVVLSQRDVGSDPLQVPYAVAVTKLSASAGPTAGGYSLKVAGRGFAGASTWALTDGAGTPVASLPVVTSLDGVDAGVLIGDDTKATVKMPAFSGAFGAVVLTITPDQDKYPGATYLPTSKAVFVYSDAG